MAGKTIESKDDFMGALVSQRDLDIMLGSASIGPHRDGLIFNLNDRDINSVGSRGKWRSLILALNFAEIELLKMMSFRNLTINVKNTYLIAQMGFRPLFSPLI